MQPYSWQPGYGYPMYPKQANGTVILILGILSICGILCCGLAGLAVGIVSWVLGNSALKDIDAGLADPSQRGQVVGGRVCGIIGTCLNVLSTGVMAFMYASDFHKIISSP
jgi:hypothetical protein